MITSETPMSRNGRLLPALLFALAGLLELYFAYSHKTPTGSWPMARLVAGVIMLAAAGYYYARASKQA
jgi:hypothetical protein